MIEAVRQAERLLIVWSGSDGADADCRPDELSWRSGKSV